MTAKRLQRAQAKPIEISDERKRAQVPFRTTASIRQRLIERASANDRSLTEELERLIERGLADEDNLGGATTAHFLRGAALAIQQVEEKTGKGWTEDTETWRAVQVLMERHLKNWRPSPPDHLIIAEAARAVDVAKRKYVEAGEAYGSQFPRPEEDRTTTVANAFMPDRPALSYTSSPWRFPHEAKDKSERSQMDAAWAQIKLAGDNYKKAQQALEDAFAAYDAADERGRELALAMISALDLVAAREV
ncbi:MAG: hypothetical protein ABIQ32_13105 [Sphingomicrobium sp.]